MSARLEDMDPELVLTTLKTLWSHLLLHDEVCLAEKLLECAPWKVRDSAAVNEMKCLTRKMLEHVYDPQVYYRMYGDYASGMNGVEAIPLPNAVLHEYSQWPRYDLFDRTLRTFENQGQKVLYLDIGSHDGWLTNRAGIRGHHSFGIDACLPYVDLANLKSREFNTGAQHTRSFFTVEPFPNHFPKKYDLITCFEVYEHVPETSVLVNHLAQLLKPGGKLLLTTPHGSWLRGIQVNYHEGWDEAKPKEHIRAPTMNDVRRDLESAGLRVDSIDSSISTWTSPDIPGQSSLLAVATMVSK